MLFNCDGNGQNPGTVINNTTFEINQGSNIARAPFSGCGTTVPVITNEPGATLVTLTGGNLAFVQVAIDNQGTVDTQVGETVFTTDVAGHPDRRTLDRQ